MRGSVIETAALLIHRIPEETFELLTDALAFAILLLTTVTLLLLVFWIIPRGWRSLGYYERGTPKHVYAWWQQFRYWLYAIMLLGFLLVAAVRLIFERTDLVRLFNLVDLLAIAVAIVLAVWSESWQSRGIAKARRRNLAGDSEE